MFLVELLALSNGNLNVRARVVISSHHLCLVFSQLQKKSKLNKNVATFTRCLDRFAQWHESNDT